MQLLQNVHRTLTWVCFILKLRNDCVLLVLRIALKLFLRQLEAVFLLQGHYHTTEVLPNKVDDELISSVVVSDSLFRKDLIGEVGTCFEGNLFGKNKSVVTVKQEIFDLEERRSVRTIGTVKHFRREHTGAMLTV
jgi:hypothetical protein